VPGVRNKTTHGFQTPARCLSRLDMSASPHCFHMPSASSKDSHIVFPVTHSACPFLTTHTPRAVLRPHQDATKMLLPDADCAVHRIEDCRNVAQSLTSRPDVEQYNLPHRRWDNAKWQGSSKPLQTPGHASLPTLLTSASKDSHSSNISTQG